MRAAAEAGFAAMGLAAGEYLRLRDEGLVDADFVKVLDARGMVVDEIEALRLDEERRNEDVLWHMAELFGASHVHVLGPHLGDVARGADELSRLCDAAVGHGVRVAIEFFPPTNVPDVRTAMDLIESSGADAGICIDTWHHFRGAADWDALAGISPDRVVSIQISDGPTQPQHPDYFEDTITNRLPPGDGEFDLVRFVRTLDENGVVAPYSVEVFSATPAAPDPGELARLLADRTRAVLAQARNPVTR